MRQQMQSLILLLMILLSSCAAFPKVKPVEICGINYDGDYCRCASFDFNEGKMKAVSESTNHSLEYCDKNIGLSPEGWENLINYLKDIYAWKEKYYKKGFKYIFKPTDDLQTFVRGLSKETE